MANILKTGQWSKHYPRCLNCQTTEIPHRAEGLCDRCYMYLYRMATRFGYVTTRDQFGKLVRKMKGGKTQKKKPGSKTGGREFE